METFVSFLLAAFAGLLAIPVLLFCVEVFAAVAIPQRELLSPAKTSSRQRVAVLVPAHNEGKGLLSTLDDIKAQLRPDDRLLVVADNCTDDTAAVARLAGADVAERNDPAKMGKGYALDWGLRHLNDDPPGIVIIIDADSRLANEALYRLETACAATGRPVQALYLMNGPVDSSVNYSVAAFAFRVKNWIRPLGLRALHLPCQLMGTGMALPWELVRSINLATGEVVEDLKLGLELAEAGHPPLFCPSASVTSQFPSSIKGAKSQRKRWEQGHLAMIVTAFPRLLCKSLARRDFNLLALALDMLVPPLTLLGMMVSAMLLISGIAFLIGVHSTALIVSVISLLAYSLAIVVCWLNCGREILPLSSIFSVASYAVSKLPLYRQILSRGDGSEWIRTDRGKN